jgi:hypothetical protein
LVILDAIAARFGMMTSCAWFFDDVAGHETMLILRQAAYAIATLGDGALEREFLDRLSLAKSGNTAEVDAAQAYRKWVSPLRPGPAA